GDLCAEAIRLARILRELMPAEAENLGLLALMLLQDSRRLSRIGSGKQLIPLEEQDRSVWDTKEIDEGLALVEKALRMGRGRVGPYQLQAAIGALHAQAKTAAETDWKEIAALYGELLRIMPTPVVALNRAVAVAMSEGLEEGLALLEQSGASGKLD